MAEVVRFQEKSQGASFDNSNVATNVEWAKKWYKTKEWLPGMKVKLGDAGSAQGGMIKNGSLTISYKGPFASRARDMAQPLFCGSSEQSFRAALEESYEAIYQNARNQNERHNITKDSYF